MNIFFYCIIFVIGILFGSFYTLAVYRIPLKQDITHTHSYCPNCKHKLGFFELIPVFSYIFLKGKCKNCGEKIRIRYLLLELFSGAVFVLLSMALKLNIYNLEMSKIIFFAFSALYITCIFLIAGIDKENKKVENSVLYFGMIIATIYIVYLYIVEQVNIYRYAIYLILFLALVIIKHTGLKNKEKYHYTIDILMLITIMTIFTGEYVTINTITVGLLAIAIYCLIKKLQTKKIEETTDIENTNEKISIAYFLCCANMVVFLVTIWLCNT